MARASCNRSNKSQTPPLPRSSLARFPFGEVSRGSIARDPWLPTIALRGFQSNSPEGQLNLARGERSEPLENTEHADRS
jgi:hypothetical protein